MGTYYEGIAGDVALKTLADAIKQNNADMDDDVAALVARGGEGALDVIKNAIKNARAAGVAAGAKTAGKTEVKVARAGEIKKQIAAMEEKYKTAQEMRRHVEMVAAKNHITKLRNELNMLDAVAE